MDGVTVVPPVGGRVPYAGLEKARAGTVFVPAREDGTGPAVTSALAPPPENTVVVGGADPAEVDGAERPWEACPGASLSFAGTWVEELGEPYGGDETVEELAYRLYQRGARFVAGPGRRSVTDVEAGFASVDRIPLAPSRRARPTRTWRVPFADVVVDTAGASAERVMETVDALLMGRTGDLRITLVGDWRRLGEGRHTTIDDPDLDPRLVREHYRCEGRVRFLEEIPERDPDVPFRLFPPVGVRPREDALERLFLICSERGHGLVVGDGGWRWERTVVFARARRAGVAESGIDALVRTYTVRDGELSEDVDLPRAEERRRLMEEASRRAAGARAAAELWERRLWALTGGRWSRLLLGRRPL
ncbi:hypothetical protein ACFWZ7_18820 [Nocardiopsis alba]|uniref:hypothetical protein n=1 Tax=Nocardiopsis alba TaxID=53437 RepID=UPI0034085E87